MKFESEKHPSSLPHPLPPQRRLAWRGWVTAMALLALGCVTAPHTPTAVETRVSQAAISPDLALTRLKEGNRRFLEGQPLRRDLNSQRQATAGGQYPFAVVLGCMDSRCAPEQVFDQGIGDLFSVRLAGNVVNEDVLGSLEFACRVAGAKLIVVLGHSQCGAIKGAASQVQLGHLTALLQRIQPSVAAATPGAPGTPSMPTPTPSQLEAITENHARRMVGQIADQSPVLMDLQRTGNLKIVGGIYSLETGMVRFLE